MNNETTETQDYIVCQTCHRYESLECGMQASADFQSVHEGHEIKFERSRRILKFNRPISQRELAESMAASIGPPAPTISKIQDADGKDVFVVNLPPLKNDGPLVIDKIYSQSNAPNFKAIVVDKRTHRIRYEGETESEVTISIEKKDG